MLRLASALLLVVLWSLQATASAQTYLRVDAPAANAVVGDTVTIRAVAMGPVSRVEASIGSRVTALSGGSQPTGSLSLTGEVAGDKTLTVSAYDASNVVTSVTVPIKLDRPPSISLLEPLPGTVSRDGKVRVRATCLDDGPTPCTFASAGGAVHDLDEQRAAANTVAVTATDSSGQTSSASVSIFNEPSDKLREVFTATSGEVLDYDGTRAIVRATGQRSATLVTASSTVPLYAGDASVVRGELYPGGALVVAGNTYNMGEPTSRAWVWNGTQSVESGFDGRVNGTYLLLSKASSIQQTNFRYLSVIDTTTGVEKWSTNKQSTSFMTDFEVAANGDFIYQVQTSTGSLTWLHGGVAKSAGASRNFTSLRIDSLHAAATSNVTNEEWLTLYTETANVELCRATQTTGGCPPAALAGGFSVYKVPDPGQPTVYRHFRRSPSGGVQELVGLPAASRVGWMRDDGMELIATLSGSMLIGDGIAPAITFAQNVGKIVRRDRWYFLLGRSVFEIVPSGGVVIGGDAGVDAGSPVGDASMPIDAAAGDPAMADASDLDTGAPEPSLMPDAAVADAAGADLDATPPRGGGSDARMFTDDSGASDAVRIQPKDDGCALSSRVQGGPWALAIGMFALVLRSRRRRQSSSTSDRWR